MSDDQVLADLQRLMDSDPAGPSADPLIEIEEIAKGHESRIGAILERFRSERATIEAAVAARSQQGDAQAREEEIARIKAEIQHVA